MHLGVPSPPLPPFDNDKVIGTNWNLLHHHYQEEEDVLIEIVSPPLPYPHPSPLDNDNVIGTNQCVCLPKAELRTKNSTKRQLCCCLVEFLVFNSAFGRHRH